MPKIDYKNWKYGDTFYLKVPKELEMDYSYIIIYSVSEDRTKKKIVYIKLANEMPEKVDEEYLNNCEFLCTATSWYEDRFWPLVWGESVDDMIERKSKIKYYPDEYGILHVYLAKIFFNNTHNSLLQSLVYLGNFNLKLPREEFVPWSEGMFPSYFLNDQDSLDYSNIKEFVNDVKRQYHEYNLKESIIFDKDYSTEMREKAKAAFEFSYHVKEFEKEFLEKQSKE